MLAGMGRVYWLRVFLLTFVLGTAPLARGQHASRQGSQRVPHAAASARSAQAAPIPAAEFSRIVQEFSEPGGYFQSDNFTSNETSYLHVVPKLKELGISGGAYIGVGPEQNFTYIAKVRPAIAFIVDIRREAILQHLLYKAIFHLAKDRAEFLSLLFSRPLSTTRAEARGTLLDLLKYMDQASSSRELFNKNLNAIREAITEEFRIPLSGADLETLTYIDYVFWRLGIRIAWGQGFPNLADLILETDLDGHLGNYLASEEDFQFVRRLQESNRVIPVVGDFGGTKALASVAGYLKKNGYTVSAFYTSNVEEYLYANDAFGGFAENVRKLPINDRSVFIRSVKAYLARHPASVPGYRMISLLEKIPVFLDDYDNGRYSDYSDLVSTHYIGATKSPEKSAPALQSR